MSYFRTTSVALCIILTVFTAQAVRAQTPHLDWAMSAGGTGADFGNAVAIDAQGNVYTTGFFAGSVDFDPGPGVELLTSGAYSDIFILKTDAAGNFVWVKSIGGSGLDDGNAIAVGASGNIFITGSFAHTVDFDPGVGTFYLTNADDPCNTEIFILKLTNNGDFVWARSVEGTMTVCTAATDVGSAIDIDQEESVYVTGFWTGLADFNTSTNPADTLFYQSSGATISGDIFILKIDSAGTFKWAKQLGIELSDWGYGLHVSDSGYVYVTGLYGWAMDFDPGPGVDSVMNYGNWDAFIMKLDTAGNYVWAIGIGGTNDDRGIAVTTDADGNVYGTGHFSNTADFNPGTPVNNLTCPGGQGAYLLKLDPAGNYLWAKAVIGNGGGEKAGAGIALDVNKNIYVTGHFTQSADFNMSPLPADTFFLTATGAWNNTDAFIMKTDSAGNFQWAVSMGVGGVDRGKSIAVDAADNVYTTGYFVGTADFDPESGVYNLVGAGSNDIYIQKLNQIMTEVGSDTPATLNTISLYPSPATDVLFISSNNKATMNNSVVVITDVNGRTVSTATATPSENIVVNVAGLDAGIYFVTIMSEGRQEVFRFVKN